MAYLDRNGVPVYYEITGATTDSPPLLLTHGFGASSAMWRPNLEALAVGRPVITWDMRGHGRSGDPADQAAYTQAACVADMAAILAEAGVTRAVLGGLSLGGYLSLAFRLVHPELVTGLILADTGPGFRNDAARQRWNERAIALAERVQRDGLRAAGGGAETTGTEHRSALGLANAARGMLTQADGTVIESLPDVAVPTLILVGADDEPFLGAADYMAAKIPRSRRVTIAGAGHACNVDQPEEFNQQVLAFLADPASTDAPAFTDGQR